MPLWFILLLMPFAIAEFTSTNTNQPELQTLSQFSKTQLHDFVLSRCIPNTLLHSHLHNAYSFVWPSNQGDQYHQQSQIKDSPGYNVLVPLEMLITFAHSSGVPSKVISISNGTKTLWQCAKLISISNGTKTLYPDFYEFIFSCFIYKWNKKKNIYIITLCNFTVVRGWVWKQM